MWDDPLTFLPRTQLQEVRRQATIYGPDKPPDRLYVVGSGRVKVATIAEDGTSIVGRVVGAEGLFGEVALLWGRGNPATAVALERTTLMSWASEEVELQIINEPRLGMALMQYFIREVLELQDRVEAMARYNIPERVLLALLHFATRLGSTEPDGRLRMSPLTHQTIAEYVGTSREVVTFQMNHLRLLGVIRYSRRYIAVDVAAAHASLREVGSQAQRRTALRNAQTGGSST